MSKDAKAKSDGPLLLYIDRQGLGCLVRIKHRTPSGQVVLESGLRIYPGKGHFYGPEERVYKEWLIKTYLYLFSDDDLDPIVEGLRARRLQEEEEQEASRREGIARAEARRAAELSRRPEAAPSIEWRDYGRHAGSVIEPGEHDYQRDGDKWRCRRCCWPSSTGQNGLDAGCPGLPRWGGWSERSQPKHLLTKSELKKKKLKPRDVKEPDGAKFWGRESVFTPLYDEREATPTSKKTRRSRFYG